MSLFHLLRHKTIPISVHQLEQFLDWCFFTKELFQTQSTIIVSVHGVEELVHASPAMITTLEVQQFINYYLHVHI